MTVGRFPIPGLFGGVSEQIPAMRHPTQCDAQDNGIATVVDGLFKRPGTKLVKVLPLTGPNGTSVSGSFGAATAHTIDKGADGLFELILVAGNLMLYELTTGAVQTVAFPKGRDYLASTDPEHDFRCITVADYTFVVNQAKKVTLRAATDALNPTNVAYINVRTSVSETTYSTIIDGQYVGIGSPEESTNEKIANALRNAINGQVAGVTAYILPGTNIIKVIKGDSSHVLTCTVSDGWGNQALQNLTAGVPTYSDLPAAFETGYTVTIKGTASSTKDAYYVKWDGKSWVETKKPGIPDTFDALTMPHQLRPDGSGGWVFEPAPTWDTRKVGDDDTNPVPSFVDNGIRGVFFFRNRLGFLAGDSLVLSRAGSYFNFWSSSATEVLATDPIDLGATSEQVETLDWAVVFNQSLLVWASPKQQFVLAGGDILSPETARLLPATSFESFAGARPVALGNQVLYASTNGSSCQVSRYRVSEDRVTNTSEDLTEHVPSTIPAAPRMLAASSTAKIVAVVPSGTSKSMWLYKYELDDKDALTQKAWQPLILNTPETVRFMGAHWVSRKLYILTHRIALADPVVGGRFQVDVLDMDLSAPDLNVGFGLHLDSRVLAAVGTFDGTNTVLDVPYGGSGQLTFLKCVAGSEPQLLTVVSSSLLPTVEPMTRTVVAGNLTGATVWAGSPFTFRYRFTEAYLRDRDGVPVMAAALKTVRVLLRYEDTGWFRAKVIPFLRGTWVYPFNGRTIGQPGQGPSQLSLSTGTFKVPVQARPEGTIVELESDSYLPCKFPYAEWVVDVTPKARS